MIFHNVEHITKEEYEIGNNEIHSLGATIHFSDDLHELDILATDNEDILAGKKKLFEDE